MPVLPLYPPSRPAAGFASCRQRPQPSQERRWWSIAGRAITPAQHRPPRRQRLVKARAGSEMRRGLERGVAILRAQGDAAQRTDELVEHRLALRLGRLDEHRAMDHEREKDRHRMRSEEHTSELQSLMRIS